MNRRIFIDESIYDNFGFIATAIVFGDNELEEAIARQLVLHGLTPGIDEFKTSAQMAVDRNMRSLRARLKRTLASFRAPVAVLVTALTNRGSLAEETFECLLKLDTNGAKIGGAEVLFDQGIRRPRSQLGLSFRPRFEQDSRKVVGLQAADLVAGMFGRALTEAMGGKIKEVAVHGGQYTAELGWVFKMQLRENLISKQPPLVDENYDDWNTAKLLGHGVFIGRDLPASVSEAIASAFDEIWLGCTR